MNQRLKEFGIILPTLADPYIPQLKMPELVKKKTAPKTIKDKKTSPREDGPIQGKVLFAGKSPGEILFEKNRQKQQKLEEDEMTKSQIRREETKDVMNIVSGIADDIGNMFSTSNIKQMEERKVLRSPKSKISQYQKAEDTEELAIATGQIPDWAITKGGTTINLQPELHDIPDPVPEYELENAESSITVQPPTKNNFMIENSQSSGRDPSPAPPTKAEDDGAYDFNVDEDHYQNLKSQSMDNQVRKSYVYDDIENEDTNQITGKFFAEGLDKHDDEMQLDDLEEPQSYSQQQWKSPDPKEVFDDPKSGQKNDGHLSSYQARRNQGKKQRIDPQETTEDTNSNEIESILMGQNQSSEKSKPPPRAKKEWSKSGRRPYNRKIGTHMEKDSNPINYSEKPNPFEDDDDDEVPEEMKEDLDIFAPTPKPNTKYPVPSRENEFGEASFGNQTRQYREMRDKFSDTPAEQITVSSEKAQIKQSLSPNTGPVSTNLSKIPTIKKNNSMERRMGEKKQIRSFVEEHNDELEEVPVPHTQDEDDIMNANKISRFNNPSTLNVPNSVKNKQEDLSVKNNYNLSTKPQVKSESNSGLNDEFSQKEDSVHMDGKNFEVHSDINHYGHVESVGDTALYNLNNESVVHLSDPVTSAAINSSINSELQKISQSLEKLLQITGRKDAHNLKLMPEVAAGVNKSFNQWLSLMVNLKANSGGSFEANIKF